MSTAGETIRWTFPDWNHADASRMLELLSDILRDVLRSDATHETTLSTEVEFLERYLAIEQVRYSDRLRPHIEVDAGVTECGYLSAHGRS